MVDHAVAAQLAVVDGLGAVAVRVEQERAVVVVAVPAARARLAGIAVAGAHAGLPERLDVLARGATKPMCSRRVTRPGSSPPASEKSSHSAYVVAVGACSIPIGASTVR